jgi:small-conductance mechanosensitive channel
MIERERLIEIGASVTGDAVMVALLYAIGASHTEEVNGHQELSASGGELVVFSIVAFVVLMAAVGVLLIYTVTVVEAERDEANGNSA